MKLITVIGARPQFVKAATVSRVISNKSKIEEIIIHTGQHYDKNMSDVFFDEMDIPRPNYNLNIHGNSHGAMTAQMLMGIEEILVKERPGCVLVYGDTNSTLAGALAASKLHIPIAHVEAGLRSYNMLMPEEINRIVCDRLSSLLYCPTQQAIKNLNKEGFQDFKAKVEFSGDVMFDAVKYYKEKSRSTSKIVDNLNLERDSFILVTIHRAENTDNIERLKGIFTALSTIASKYKIVIPLHPRTRKIIRDEGIECSKLMIIDPVGYFDMLQLINNCKLVLTDSGGLQKEAYFFEKPCVTMRDETEWVELIESGNNILTGANTELIIKAVDLMADKQVVLDTALYGNGNAAEFIVNSISNSL